LIKEGIDIKILANTDDQSKIPTYVIHCYGP